MCVPVTGTGLSPSQSLPAPAEIPWKPPSAPLGWCNLQPAVLPRLGQDAGDEGPPGPTKHLSGHYRNTL